MRLKLFITKTGIEEGTMKKQFTCTHDRKLFADGCATCHYMNRKPRTAVTLQAAMDFAKQKIGEGREIHLRDEETGAVQIFSKFAKYRPTDFDVTNPERRVFVLALS